MSTPAMLLCLALAQEPSPAPAEPPPEQAAAAARDLTALAARYRDVEVLRARYVQRRKTELLAEPLLSEGELWFQREPGCVLFRADQPRPVVVRLDEQVYEVYRPSKRRLERFRLPSPELPRALFAALHADATVLQRDFAVQRLTTLGAAGELHRIELEPRDARYRERLTELAITLAVADARLAAVAYRDGSGDLIELELHDLVLDPKPTPRLSIEVPEGTEVVEHAPPPPDPGGGKGSESPAGK